MIFVGSSLSVFYHVRFSIESFSGHHPTYCSVHIYLSSGNVVLQRISGHGPHLQRILQFSFSSIMSPLCNGALCSATKRVLYHTCTTSMYIIICITSFSMKLAVCFPRIKRQGKRTYQSQVPYRNNASFIIIVYKRPLFCRIFTYNCDVYNYTLRVVIHK